MKKLFPLLMFLLAVLAFGCVAEKHRRYVREGLIVTGLNREAFLKEWGPPDRTYTISSEEFTSLSAGWGGDVGGVGYFKGKVPLNVWVYKDKETDLVFHGVRLIGWKTEKTVKQLRIETPPKPQSMGEHARQSNEIPEKKVAPPAIHIDKVVVGVLDFEMSGPAIGQLAEKKEALMKELRRNTRVMVVDIRESCSFSDLKRNGYEKAEGYEDNHQLDMILHVQISGYMVYRSHFSLLDLYRKKVKEVSIDIRGPIEQGFTGVSKKLLASQDVNRILSAKTEAFGKKK